MTDPVSTYIDAGVKIGKDTTILPNTYLHGATEIGEGNVIQTRTRSSAIRKLEIAVKCWRLCWKERGLKTTWTWVRSRGVRKGAHLKSHVHMGNFGGVKDSTLEEGVKMGHFSYIGNAKIGANTNIGAGTVTANYDGENKLPTEIGEDVFIGVDTMLVAPLVTRRWRASPEQAQS
ncbi:MAG: hypothetical protein U0X92_13380 [Anaerolineales bacterium]